MSLTVQIKRFLKFKIATAVLIMASVAAFATLGDGGKKFSTGKTSVSKSFSLRTTHNYRANNLFKGNQPRYITLNTVVTYQKGNATYIVPLKKKVILDKVKFNPAPVKY